MAQASKGDIRYNRGLSLRDVAGSIDETPTHHSERCIGQDTGGVKWHVW
jgi:hypothetical protein